MHSALRIQPSEAVLDATRAWLGPVRDALGGEFLAAYLTGSVLVQGFDPRRSRVNVMVVARALGPEILERLAKAVPAGKTPPRFEPLFLTRHQLEKSLDVFPIEWLEIQERHLRIEGDDLFATLDVPRRYLRLQLEHELRGKHIQLRQSYLAAHDRPAELTRILKGSASGFATLFRTLLRLSGETPPAETGHVIERVCDLFQLDAQALLGAHLVRFSGKRYAGEEIVAVYRKFLGEVDRLVDAIDRLPVT